METYGDRRRKQATSYSGKTVKQGMEFEVFFWYNWEVNNGIVQYKHTKKSRRAESMLSSQFHFYIVNDVCQVQENNRGNFGNSGCQVQTYEMLEGTSASAYVLHPFQTLGPRFWNKEDGV